VQVQGAQVRADQRLERRAVACPGGGEQVSGQRGFLGLS